MGTTSLKKGNNVDTQVTRIYDSDDKKCHFLTFLLFQFYEDGVWELSKVQIFLNKIAPIYSKTFLCIFSHVCPQNCTWAFTSNLIVVRFVRSCAAAMSLAISFKWDTQWFTLEMTKCNLIIIRKMWWMEFLQNSSISYTLYYTNNIVQFFFYCLRDSTYPLYFLILYFVFCISRMKSAEDCLRDSRQSWRRSLRLWRRWSLGGCSPLSWILIMLDTIKSWYFGKLPLSSCTLWPVQNYVNSDGRACISVRNQLIQVHCHQNSCCSALFSSS